MLKDVDHLSLTNCGFFNVNNSYKGLVNDVNGGYTSVYTEVIPMGSKLDGEKCIHV